MPLRPRPRLVVVADDWSGRKTLLKLGAMYRVRQDALARSGLPFTFGERVRLRHIGYSIYDGAHGYAFETADGAVKSFFLRDEEPVSRLLETFEVVCGGPGSPAERKRS